VGQLLSERSEIPTQQAERGTLDALKPERLLSPFCQKSTLLPDRNAIDLSILLADKSIQGPFARSDEKEVYLHKFCMQVSH
jgi:hypothetical protein